MPDSGRNDTRTEDEIVEHYRLKEERIALHFKQKAERHAARDAAHARGKLERTTKKLQVKSAAHIKQWKSKLKREEDRRLKSRDEREISRVEVRAAGVEEGNQNKRNVSDKKESDWAAPREAEAEKHRIVNEVVSEREAARRECRK